MSIKKEFVSFSLNRLDIVPLLDDSKEETLYGDKLINCGGVQDTSVTPTSSEYVLEGDGGTVDVQTVNEGYEFSFTNGIMSFEQMQVMENSEIREIKDENDVVTGQEYISKSTDKPQYFAIIGYVENSNLKVVLPKCKVNSVELSFANKTHAVLSVSGRAIKRLSDGVTRKLIRTENAEEPTLNDLL